MATPRPTHRNGLLRRLLHRLVALLTILPLLGLLAACSSGGDTAKTSTGAPKELRLGFFSNVTHATPLAGIEKGLYTKELGETQLKTQVFNAGPAAVEALFAGSLDATYIGPNPAINAFVKSNGEAIRIIAGATSGGASLVVKEGINSPADLKGKKLATPQLGNTQDVALRSWLAGQGLKTTKEGTGDVSIVPTENATTLQLFRDGKIDGGWLPEPWASRLVLEANAKVLLDERTLWPDGKFVTTHLIVATKFLKENPKAVEALLRAHVATNDWINKNPAEAKAAVNKKIGELSGKPLAQNVLDRAWTQLQVTNDPIAASLQKGADNAVAVDLLKKTSLQGIYDLGPLNAVLKNAGQPPVSDAGLGQKG